MDCRKQVRRSDDFVDDLVMRIEELSRLKILVRCCLDQPQGKLLSLHLISLELLLALIAALKKVFLCQPLAVQIAQALILNKELLNLGIIRVTLFAHHCFLFMSGLISLTLCCAFRLFLLFLEDKLLQVWFVLNSVEQDGLNNQVKWIELVLLQVDLG